MSASAVLGRHAFRTLDPAHFERERPQKGPRPRPLPLVGGILGRTQGEHQRVLDSGRQPHRDALLDERRDLDVSRVLRCGPANGCAVATPSAAKSSKTATKTLRVITLS